MSAESIINNTVFVDAKAALRIMILACMIITFLTTNIIHAVVKALRTVISTCMIIVFSTTNIIHAAVQVLRTMIFGIIINVYAMTVSAFA
ncbi:hypothetical protein M3221_22875 [Domibacillus indicus]|uniref:hypothetical protein n=1 Tax=Domibacillus indicus TaxID=1437523 RepID=UPI00203E0564|nr:hypothetical protein [Domibacillus indicus]MCM3791183.1 hypothetical protein [Domibacillus indicus]